MDTARLPDHPPPLPLLYLDWNVVQHLQDNPTCAPLLAAVLTARDNGAAWIPWTFGHMSDATAGWHQLSEGDRHSACAP
jgi:hypothetical protein